MPCFKYEAEIPKSKLQTVELRVSFLEGFNQALNLADQLIG
jgi:hypothetical protein